MNRHDFAQLGLATLEPNIDFADLVPVFRDYTNQTNNTTARWTGEIAAPTTGDYTFYAIILTFVLLALVLAVRPNGLFGKPA